MNLTLYSHYLKLRELSLLELLKFVDVLNLLELLKFVDVLQFFFPSNANFSTGPDAIANNHNQHHPPPPFPFLLVSYTRQWALDPRSHLPS